MNKKLCLRHTSQIKYRNRVLNDACSLSFLPICIIETASQSVKYVIQNCGFDCIVKDRINTFINEHHPFHSFLTKVRSGRLQSYKHRAAVCSNSFICYLINFCYNSSKRQCSMQHFQFVSVLQDLYGVFNNFYYLNFLVFQSSAATP